MHNKRYNKASSRIAQREKTRKNLSLFLRVSLAAVIVFGIVSVFRADFLQVDVFEIEGGEALGKENIQNAALSLSSGTSFWFIPKSNIIFLNKDALANALLSKFGRLQSVEVNKNYFSQSIKLSVSERSADFLWCLPAQAGSEEDRCFFMNKGGLVFEESLKDEDLVIFKGVLEGDPLMKNFASPEKMRNYTNLVGVLGSSGFQVNEINIESADRAVARTNKGDIIFSPDEEDLSLTAQNIILLVNEIKSKTPSADFEYIDARFGNKIFYKLY